MPLIYRAQALRNVPGADDPEYDQMFHHDASVPSGIHPAQRDPLDEQAFAFQPAGDAGAVCLHQAPTIVRFAAKTKGTCT